jgi:hypothetical protein
MQDTATEAILVKRGEVKDTSYQNYASGEFTPGRGFDMVRSKYGSLNISLYAIARYLNNCQATKPGRTTLAGTGNLLDVMIFSGIVP